MAGVPFVKPFDKSSAVETAREWTASTAVTDARTTAYEGRHAMVDLETLSSPPNAAIIEAAVVEFTPLPPFRANVAYYRRFKLEDVMSSGLRVEPQTLKWWSRQENFEKVMSGETPLQGGLEAIKETLSVYDHIWARSPIFDCANLRDAMRATNVHPLWGLENRRKFQDVRSAIAPRPDFGVVQQVYRNSHNSVEDCLKQIVDLINHCVFFEPQAVPSVIESLDHNMLAVDNIATRMIGEAEPGPEYAPWEIDPLA